MTSCCYVVAAYVSVVGKDGKKLEDYVPDGLSVETLDFKVAKKFFENLNLEKIASDWLHPNEKNYCCKVEKEISLWSYGQFSELVDCDTTTWLRLKDAEKSLTELVPLNAEEKRKARV